MQRLQLRTATTLPSLAIALMLLACASEAPNRLLTPESATPVTQTSDDDLEEGGEQTQMLWVRKVKIGMGATPLSTWDQRLSETGPVDARRIFGTLGSSGSVDSTIALAASEVAAGRMPILSYKLPDTDWRGAAAGTYDTQLRDIATRLAALPGKVFITLHHEPQSDGTPADYAAMQLHVLPILAPPRNVLAGVIVNGFWFSARSYGRSDAEIAEWLPPKVLALAEVVAADTYDDGTLESPGEPASTKILRLSAWATRVGVRRLGIGEYGSLDADSVTAAGDAILADRRFVFGCVYNSNVNSRFNWVLSGARLAAFKATLAKAHAQ
jgi:hypothetical protein